MSEFLKNNYFTIASIVLAIVSVIQTIRLNNQRKRERAEKRLSFRYRLVKIVDFRNKRYGLSIESLGAVYENVVIYECEIENTGSSILVSDHLARNLRILFDQPVTLVNCGTQKERHPDIDFDLEILREDSQEVVDLNFASLDVAERVMFFVVLSVPNRKQPKLSLRGKLVDANSKYQITSEDLTPFDPYDPTDSFGNPKPVPLSPILALLWVGGIFLLLLVSWGLFQYLRIFIYRTLLDVYHMSIRASDLSSLLLTIVVFTISGAIIALSVKAIRKYEL